MQSQWKENSRLSLHLVTMFYFLCSWLFLLFLTLTLFWRAQLWIYFCVIFSYGYIQVINFWQKYHENNVVFFLVYHINRPMLLICLVIDEITPIICLTWYLPGFSTVKLFFPLQLESCGELLWGYLYTFLLLKKKKSQNKILHVFFLYRQNWQAMSILHVMAKESHFSWY